MQSPSVSADLVALAGAASCDARQQQHTAALVQECLGLLTLYDHILNPALPRLNALTRPQLAASKVEHHIRSCEGVFREDRVS